MRLILFFLILSLFISPSLAGELKHLYSTWETVELDTIASAWLIKRFIDKEAEFKFYPKGELITEGIAFDTPEAESRRRQNESTFESILNKYKITDPVLLEIGKIIHDIEIDYWIKKSTDKSEKIDSDVNEIINSSKDKTECLQKGIIYFDNLYEELK